VTRVLLITGARSLATRPGAETWARGHIAEALRGVDLLIVGDAPGPDAWAREIARDRGRVTRCAQAVYAVRGDLAGWIIDESGRGVSEWTESRYTHPLERNRVMVHDAKEMGQRRDDISVLALLDGLKVDVPGKRATRGTEHTVGLARAAGLTVREEVWRG
jgi:hypothetical protein